jgi:hypothetical protein
LAVSNWQLAIGNWQLAIGNWQLAKALDAKIAHHRSLPIPWGQFPGFSKYQIPTTSRLLLIAICQLLIAIC